MFVKIFKGYNEAFNSIERGFNNFIKDIDKLNAHEIVSMKA